MNVHEFFLAIGEPYLAGFFVARSFIQSVAEVFTIQAISKSITFSIRTRMKSVMPPERTPSNN